MGGKIIVKRVITKDVTMSALVEVEVDADSLDPVRDASTIMLSNSFYEDAQKANFVLDDSCDTAEAYFADSGDYTVEIDGIDYSPSQFEAYENGKGAFEQGLDPSDNPYGSMSERYLPWENGWMKAQEEDVDATPGDNRF